MAGRSARRCAWSRWRSGIPWTSSISSCGDWWRWRSPRACRAFCATSRQRTSRAGSFRTSHSGGNQLEVRLPARVDRPEIAVSGQTPFPSPWRVVMVADIPGKLVESNLVLNLNPPSAIKDESWIQPGKTSWGWWSGTVAKNVDFTPGMNTATMKHYIDFSADAKLEFMLIDGGWSDRRDITKPSPAIDMPEIIRYAKSDRKST